MTRIILNVPQLPRSGPYGGAHLMLPRPWGWWEARLSGQDEEVVMTYEPTWNNIQQCIITFGPDGDRVTLTDPPAAVLNHISRYDDIPYGATPINRIMVTNSYLQARVVWHERPGPQWQPLPNPSCRVGEYRHDTVMDNESRWGGRELRDRPEFERSPAEGWLQWPMNPTLIDGVAVPPRAFPDRCRICERIIAAPTASGRELISGVCDECRQQRAFRQYDETRRLTREEIASIYGTPNAILDRNEEESFRREWLNRWAANTTAAPTGYTIEQIEALRDGFRRGVVTMNEVRRAEGLPPMLPSGEEILQNINDAYDEVVRSSRRLPVGDFDTQRPVDMDHPEPRFYPGDPRNPEQNVLDAIEELVNEQLAHPEDFHGMGDTRKCPNCGGDWHGLVGDGPPALAVEGDRGAESYRQVGNGGIPGCPGSAASAKEVRQWRKRNKR